MPVYKLQGPDGKVYTIEGPDGATAEQLGAFITSQASDRQAKIAAQQEADRKLYDPTNGMSTFDRLAAGAGKAVSDTGQGIGQMLGLTSRADVAETRKRDAALMNTGAGMAGNIGGNVAMALAPGGVVAGAGKLLSKVPAAAGLAEALMAGGQAMMAPTSIPQAALVGAGQGLLQPSTSTGETLTNMGVGAAASAAVPLLVRGGQVAKAALDPFSESGQRRIIGRAMNTAAGNDSATALQNLRSAGELVPGSAPTAGQAAQNPGIAALERTATATDPVAMNEMARRATLQNDARLAALQGVAPDRAASVSAREAAANQLYAAADPQPVAMTPELQALLKRPSMQTALADAQKLAAEKGSALDPAAMTGRDAHFIKRALDDATNAPPVQGFGQNQINAVRDTKSAYLSELEKQIPEYGQARSTFAQMSRPVNQADIAAEIAKKATNFRGDMTPAAYARALRDETAQGVTGQSNATLASVMDPAQMKTLQAIKDDLLRSDFAQTAGKGVGSDTVQKLAYSNLMDKSGLPSWATALPRGVGLGGIAQRIADAGYGRANKEMSSKLAQALLNPQDAAALMEAGVVTPQVQALIEGLRRGGAGIGATTPALLNAQKE